MREFACVCVHFRPINGTVESALFLQLSNLIKSLRIISPKNYLEFEKNYLSPSKSQIFSQLFCVAHSEITRFFWRTFSLVKSRSDKFN